MLPSLQVQIQIAEPSPLALTPARISYARFAHAPKAGHQRASIRLLRQITLNGSQQFVCSIASELVKPPREWPGLDEFHNVIVPQCSRKQKLVVCGAAWRSKLTAVVKLGSGVWMRGARTGARDW